MLITLNTAKRNDAEVARDFARLASALMVFALQENPEAFSLPVEVSIPIVWATMETSFQIIGNAADDDDELTEVVDFVMNNYAEIINMHGLQFHWDRELLVLHVFDATSAQYPDGRTLEDALANDSDFMDGDEMLEKVTHKGFFGPIKKVPDFSLAAH